PKLRLSPSAAAPIPNLLSLLRRPHPQSPLPPPHPLQLAVAPFTTPSPTSRLSPFSSPASPVPPPFPFPVAPLRPPPYALPFPMTSDDNGVLGAVDPASISTPTVALSEQSSCAMAGLPRRLAGGGSEL
uniref:Uncharacterized protein n=1 Tax=Triticum urartu TaxID=4572 RepID=A0A8R7V3D3_TRIUA